MNCWEKSSKAPPWSGPCSRPGPLKGLSAYWRGRGAEKPRRRSIPPLPGTLRGMTTEFRAASPSGPFKGVPDLPSYPRAPLFFSFDRKTDGVPRGNERGTPFVFSGGLSGRQLFARIEDSLRIQGLLEPHHHVQGFLVLPALVADFSHADAVFPRAGASPVEGVFDNGGVDLFGFFHIPGIRRIDHHQHVIVSIPDMAENAPLHFLLIQHV